MAQYSYKPRNIVRTGLALWRVFRDTGDPNANVHEAAFVEGFEMGKGARCLVGLDWASVYDQDLDQLRAE